MCLSTHMNDAERAVLALAASQHGAVSRRQALRAGLSSAAIGRRVDEGELIPVFKGAYRLPGTKPTWEQRVMAGQLAAGPGAVASHRAAGSLLGLPGVTRWVEVTVERPRQIRIEGITAHRTRRLVPDDVGEVVGIPVTSAARTIADLSEIYPKARLERIVDFAQANKMVTRAELVAKAQGRPFDDALVEILDERPATRRPMGSTFEASLYQRLREAGLPLPIAQYRVLIDGVEKFLDFAYPEVRFALEADSYLWHSSQEAWELERARNNGSWSSAGRSSR